MYYISVRIVSEFFISDSATGVELQTSPNFLKSVQLNASPFITNS